MRDTLNGKTRYRTASIGGLFSKRNVLVLQVECTWPDGPNDMHGLPEYMAGRGWRDARVEDLAELDIQRTQPSNAALNGDGQKS